MIESCFLDYDSGTRSKSHFSDLFIVIIQTCKTGARKAGRPEGLRQGTKEFFNGGISYERIRDRQRLYGICRRQVSAFCLRAGLPGMVHGIYSMTDTKEERKMKVRLERE